MFETSSIACPVLDLGPWYGMRRVTTRAAVEATLRSHALKRTVTSALPQTRAYVGWQLVGWTTCAIAGLVVFNSFQPLTPRMALTTVAGCAFGALGAHLLRREIHRRQGIQRLKLEVAARDAQLNALNAQIHPHFLFNALNSLRALITEDPGRARNLVTQLSELMRYALHAGRRERVSLAEELGIVEAYLRLEAARFETRLRWRIEMTGELGGAMLPPMVVQTLVENAVKHGIASVPEGGTVLVSAKRDQSSLRVRVTNPGRLVARRNGGIGLANVEQRLRLRYGTGASFALTSGEGEGVVAELVMPLEREA